MKPEDDSVYRWWSYDDSSHAAKNDRRITCRPSMPAASCAVISSHAATMWIAVQ